jgi:hypothetical protein
MRADLLLPHPVDLAQYPLYHLSDAALPAARKRGMERTSKAHRNRYLEDKETKMTARRTHPLFTSQIPPVASLT